MYHFYTFGENCLMQVHILKPYREDKNLGRAYNEAVARIGEDDWACLCDLDTCFLTPDAGTILHNYAKQNPSAGILTCFTNRIGPLSRKQLLGHVVSDNADMRYHVQLAEKQKQFLYTTRPIIRDISGMLMMISKRTWNNYKFSEDLLCLGVDTDYNRKIRAAGKSILRMNGLYIWHTYRLLTGITHKEHLK